MVADVEIFCKGREGTEDDELKENGKSVDPVGFCESDIVAYLRCPYPPNESEEKEIRNTCLYKG